MKKARKYLLFLALLLPLLMGAGYWNGVAVTGWNGVAVTSWNGTGVSAGVAPAVVDIYVDMEDSTNGTTVTSTIAGNGTHGTGVTWSVTGTAVKVSTTFEAALRNPVSAGGTPYNDSGSTRGWQWAHATSGTARVTATTSAQNVTVCSFFFRITGVTQSYELTDVYQTGAGTAFSVFQLNTFNASPRVTIEYSNGSTQHSNYVTIANDVTYWVTHRFSASTGAHEARIYLASDYSQVGLAMTATGGGTGTTNLHHWGETSGHANSGPGTLYLDDIVLNWSGTPTFPFIP